MSDTYENDDLQKEKALRRTLKIYKTFAVIGAVAGAAGFLILAVLGFINKENHIGSLFVMPVVGFLAGLLLGMGIPGFGLCVKWLRAMNLDVLVFIFLLIVTFLYVSPFLAIIKYIRTKIELRRIYAT